MQINRLLNPPGTPPSESEARAVPARPTPERPGTTPLSGRSSSGAAPATAAMLPMRMKPGQYENGPIWQAYPNGLLAGAPLASRSTAGPAFPGNRDILPPTPREDEVVEKIIRNSALFSGKGMPRAQKIAMSVPELMDFPYNKRIELVYQATREDKDKLLKAPSFWDISQHERSLLEKLVVPDRGQHHVSGDEYVALIHNSSPEGRNACQDDDEYCRILAIASGVPMNRIRSIPGIFPVPYAVQKLRDAAQEECKKIDGETLIEWALRAARDSSNLRNASDDLFRKVIISWTGKNYDQLFPGPFDLYRQPEDIQSLVTRLREHYPKLENEAKPAWAERIYRSERDTSLTAQLGSGILEVLGLTVGATAVRLNKRQGLQHLPTWKQEQASLVSTLKASRKEGESNAKCKERFEADPLLQHLSPHRRELVANRASGYRPPPKAGSV